MIDEAHTMYGIDIYQSFHCLPYRAAQHHASAASPSAFLKLAFIRSHTCIEMPRIIASLAMYLAFDFHLVVSGVDNIMILEQASRVISVFSMG